MGEGKGKGGRGREERGYSPQTPITGADTGGDIINKIMLTENYMLKKMQVASFNLK